VPLSRSSCLISLFARARALDPVPLDHALSLAHGPGPGPARPRGIADEAQAAPRPARAMFTADGPFAGEARPGVTSTARGCRAVARARARQFVAGRKTVWGLADVLPVTRAEDMAARGARYLGAILFAPAAHVRAHDPCHDPDLARALLIRRTRGTVGAEAGVDLGRLAEEKEV